MQNGGLGALGPWGLGPCGSALAHDVVVYLFQSSPSRMASSLGRGTFGLLGPCKPLSCSAVTATQYLDHSIDILGTLCLGTSLPRPDLTSRNRAMRLCTRYNNPPPPAAMESKLDPFMPGSSLGGLSGTARTDQAIESSLDATISWLVPTRPSPGI